MSFNNEDSNMISDEFIEEAFLKNEVPDDVGCMLFRDNMNLSSPGDVFIWFKNLPFRSQKIMLSNMINVMSEDKISERTKTPNRAFGDFHVNKNDRDLFNSLGDPPLSRCETNHKPFNSNIIPNKDGSLPRLGASSPPPLLRRETSADYNYEWANDMGPPSHTSEEVHPNITLRKKE
jgi:hypothetical protein